MPVHQKNPLVLNAIQKSIPAKKPLMSSLFQLVYFTEIFSFERFKEKKMVAIYLDFYRENLGFVLRLLL
jgi:hypothetical protein